MSRSQSVASGLRVLELGHAISGQLAGMILADVGAEVVKVEPPGGDPTRAHPAFLMWARGKQSLVADLDDGGDAARVRALAAEADVVLSTRRPGRDAQTGLDPAALAAAHPRLVACHVTAFGPRGPYAGYPAHEGVVAAKAGRMLEFSGLAGGGRPAYSAVPVATYCAAQLALHGIFAALCERERSGRGQLVETSLVQALGVYDLVNWLPGSPMHVRREDVPYLPYHVACTKDGVWLQFAQLSPVQFEAFLRALGLEHVREDARFRRAPALTDPADMRALRDVLLARVRERTWDEWRAVFEKDRNLAVEPFRTAAEAMDHPQLRHNGDVIARDDPRVGPLRQLGPLVRFEVSPAQPGGPAPELGAHEEPVFAARTGVRSGGAAQAAGTGAAAPGEAKGAQRVLGDVLVLELATWVAAPFAATLLAELGARVVKIEPPGGEPFRQVRHGMPWLKTMQGKESLAVDLKRPEGREIVQALAERADLLIHNYRPGVPERLGIDAHALCARNPRLVHLYAASYGSSGPDAARPAYHPTAGALCGGALAQVGAGALPAPDAALSADDLRRLSWRLEMANETNPDPSAAVASATAALMALYHRARTGQGQALETTMLCSNAYANSHDYVDHAGRPARERADAELLGVCATYRLYAAREGWLFLSCPTPADFETLCGALGRPGWLRDPRFADTASRRTHDAELAALLAETFAERDADAWERDLAARGIGCARADRGPFAKFAFSEPFMTESGFVTEIDDAELGRYRRFGPTVRLSRDAGAVRGPCRAGEHTRAILRELGYAEERIDALGREGAVAWPGAGPG